ncbi:MAG: type IV pilus twitching motility protein PilT [Patescibacteria group bacterium]|jgi:twitching motility protein PilT|nr:type IV pilus twitching motility protein PilT [Patescibacteria group bacterium]
MTLDEIFEGAVALKASDVHLANGLPAFFRVDGVLRPIQNWPIFDHEIILKLAEPIMTPAQKEVLLKKKNLDLSYQIKNNIRFRINIFWEKGHLALAARVIQPIIPSMEEIGLPPVAHQLTQLQDGLVLVTGPTGCGKSTTLAAMIEKINTERACHIITLEDPIEYVFTSKKSLIAQRELGQDMTSFDSALKHIVRQNPDVIFVGEMRDLETIGLAITLAETGHLILATLHTTNAPQTIDRIIDVFPPYQQNQIRLQIALALRGIISQHLLPKIGGGRVAAREVLINNPAVANLIRENKIAQIKSCMQTSGKEGMCTLENGLKNLYREKIITLDTALAHATYPEELLKE